MARTPLMLVCGGVYIEKNIEERLFYKINKRKQNKCNHLAQRKKNNIIHNGMCSCYQFLVSEKEK